MVSGPPVKSINNSGLGYIKRILTGDKPFLGPQRYLQTGTEFHLRSLMRKKGKWQPIDDEEKQSMIGMVKSIYSCKLFVQSFNGSIREKLHKHPKAFGIHGMHGTLDLKVKRKGRKRIIDLKTTSETTEEGFIKKAIQLCYPRQGVVYKELDDHHPGDECFFIGVSKKNIGTKTKPNYPHFIFDLNNFTNETRRAEQEAEFLLSFYSQFGLPTKSGTKENTKIFTDPRGRQDSE